VYKGIGLALVECNYKVNINNFARYTCGYCNITFETYNKLFKYFKNYKDIKKGTIRYLTDPKLEASKATKLITISKSIDNILVKTYFNNIKEDKAIYLVKDVPTSINVNLESSLLTIYTYL
jgi:hypothetical protein